MKSLDKSVLAQRLCLPCDDSAPSSVEELDGKRRREGSFLSTRDEVTVTDGLTSLANQNNGIVLLLMFTGPSPSHKMAQW